MYPITIINAKTISDAWFRLLYEIRDNSYIQDIQRGSFEKEQYRIQYAGASIYIEYPEQDTVPYIPPGLCIPSPTTMEYIQDYFVNYLMNPELGENETYKYASRIHQNIPKAELVAGEIVQGWRYDKEGKERTQLGEVIKMLKETPLTNHAVIEIAKPKDITCCIGKDGKNDPPCLRLIDFKVIPVETDWADGSEPRNVTCFQKNGSIWKLVLTVSTYWRSWDLWAGFPSNLGGIELLKQYVAQECGLENGSMYCYSAGLHLYGYQEEIAKIRTMKNE